MTLIASVLLGLYASYSNPVTARPYGTQSIRAGELQGVHAGQVVAVYRHNSLELIGVCRIEYAATGWSRLTQPVADLHAWNIVTLSP